jgi:hypothetical protein
VQFDEEGESPFVRLLKVGAAERMRKPRHSGK